MKELFHTHFEKIFETSVLVFIFVFSTFMLAFIKNDEMARWIEGGTIIAVMIRSFGNKATPANTKQTTTSITTPPAPIEEISDVNSAKIEAPTQK